MTVAAAEPAPEKAPSLARLITLIGRHLPPTLIIAHHVFALFGRQLLKVLIALDQLLASFRRQLTEVIVLLAQPFALFGRQLTPLPHPLQHLSAFIRR